jgi:hypothetical protein
LSRVAIEKDVIKGLKEGLSPPMMKEIKSSSSIGLPMAASWFA